MADAGEQTTYDRVKEMAVAFRLRPGDRLNEGALARELGVSRTPLREALNRLVAEGLITFAPGTGFFCRDLDVQTTFDLFELRRILEAAAVRLACGRASDSALEALHRDLMERGMEVSGLTVAEACRRDEAFHMGVAKLSGNAELARDLGRVNERIRYIRWLRMSVERARASKAEHLAVMKALLARAPEKAGLAMEEHITRRMDEVQKAVRDGVAGIFMKTDTDLADRILDGTEAGA